MVLLRFEESVVHRQIHIHDHDVGHRRGSLTLAEGLGHRFGVGRTALVEQEPQRLVHAAFSLLRGQVEDRQVILDHADGPPVLQQVVGHPEPAGREHRIAVAVLLERPGLAHQPVDDVPVVDAIVRASAQAWQLLHLLAAVPDLQMIGEHPRFHDLSDQTAVDRVAVPFHHDQASSVHPRANSLGGIQTPIRQRTKPFHLFRQPGLTPAIELLEQLAEKSPVLLHRREVAAATQQQRLIHRTVKAIVALLHIAVLVRPARLDPSPFEVIVPHQRLIALLKIRPVGQVIHRRRHPIRAMQQRHPAQLPKSVLQSLAQAGEALRGADRARLPVRIRQHEVVHHMSERLTADRDPKLRHVGEIRLA